MAAPKRITLFPLGDLQTFQDALIEDDERTLGELLKEAPAFSVGTPLDADLLNRSVSRLLIKPATTADAEAGPLYPPPGMFQGAHRDIKPAEPKETHQDEPPSQPEPDSAMPVTSPDHPQQLTEAQAVAIAYRAQVKKLATFLRSRLSLLVSCEKLVVPHLWREIIAQTWVAATDGSIREIKLQPVLLELPESGNEANPIGGGNRLGRLREIIHELKPHQILVIPNLDLIGGGGEKGLNRESRELTEVIYNALDRLVLAFSDPSLPVPEVIASRFAVRAAVEGLDRAVAGPRGQPVPIGKALVLAREAAMFKDFDPQELYKIIAGLNPIRLRQAMAYAVQVACDHEECYSAENPAPLDLLVQEIRAFKAQTAEQFIVPDVTFEDIGGYGEVKATLAQAIMLISGGGNVPDEKLRHELVPRGFLFHGPPGTGKTLFAKAIANQLNATVRVVSGPEVTDMYVGESERKVRAIFAEARRNAPSVVVFDEFDAIAARRSGRDDGGSRAGNALVAQILTEMDGFRPDVPMLVIATTNRLGLIDEALLRPSRFQPVAIGLPDIVARRHIAKIHAEHFKIQLGVEILDVIAQATEGLNGDEIRALFRDACVGQYFQKPPVLADPWQLGFLVGRIRTRLDARIGQDGKPRELPVRGQRRRPSDGLMDMTPRKQPGTEDKESKP